MSQAVHLLLTATLYLHHKEKMMPKPQHVQDAIALRKKARAEERAAKIAEIEAKRALRRANRGA